MNKTQAVLATALGLAASTGGLGFMPRMTIGGRSHRIYPHDEAKIEANKATARQRIEWNHSVDQAKELKASVNRSTFVPRKRSHKAY